MLRIIFIGLIIATSSFGQEKLSFENFQGIKQDDVIFFEGEGSTIWVQKSDIEYGTRGMYKVRSKFLSNEGDIISDTTLNYSNFILVKKDGPVDAPQLTTLYLLPNEYNKIIIIGFSRGIARNLTLERLFVHAYQNNAIPENVFIKQEADTINFVGKKIVLNSVCRWMHPHNMQCPNLGQMNWAIFDNLQDAEEYRNTKLKINKTQDLTETISEEWINVKFEGVATKAIKTKTKIKLLELYTDGSDIIVVYYVTAYVRGKYVTCILSHYTDDVDADYLPPLLKQVLGF